MVSTGDQSPERGLAESVVVSNLTQDYLAFCFLSALGVFQIAAAYGRLRGLLLFRRPLVSVLAGLGLVVAGFLWFFLPGPRLIPDTEGGLDGNRQALLFFVSASVALGVTLLVSSLVNRRMLRPRHAMPGLDALRETTYVQALRLKLVQVWKRSPKQTPKSFSGSTAG